MRVVLPFLLSVLVLTGCGTTSDRQTQTVERETTVAGPLTLDTPIGQFIVQPARIERQRTQDEVERTQKRIDAPEIGPVLSAVAGGTPWGGILTGIVGLATAAFAGKKALDASRQRNEMIEGVEKSKEKLAGMVDSNGVPAWIHLKDALEKKQNKDTRDVVKARTT